MKTVPPRTGVLPVMMEAATLLLVFRVALKVVPFKRLVGAIKTGKRVVQPEREAASVRRVRWAILTVSSKVPLLNVCFPQALAAHFMLRRRGVSSTLYYGVTRSGPKLEAHTWLKAGERLVVGGGPSPYYTVLASFPSGRPGPGVEPSLQHNSLQHNR